MKKTILSAVIAATTAFGAQAVTFHQPNAEMEANLNVYGAGVANWEEARLTQLTMADAHLYHNYAMINHGEKMPLKVIGGLDVSKIMLPNVTPNKEVSLYDVMRDRGSMSSYVVMNKKGEILAEDYWNGTDKNTLFHLMSAGKSFSSMATFIAQEKGLFKLSEPVGKYIKEFRGTPWENIEIQHFADMTSGIIALPENREDYHWGNLGAGASGSWDSSMPSVLGYNGHITKEDGTVLPKPDALGELKGFDDYVAYFAKNVKPSYGKGEVYEYKDFNTEVLGLLITRTSGMTLAEFVEKNLWTKAGFNSDVAMYTNHLHESAASGSLNMTTRDFAIGSYLMVNDGKNWKGEQVLPKKLIDQVKNGDEVVKNAWGQVSYESAIAEEAFYKNQWRTVKHPVTGRVISTMIGVNGQYSAFDHKTGNIVAITGNYREPSGQAMVMTYVFDTIYTIFEQLDK
ncbi:serine hydrolase domain-containing protein [Vibrio jasicida]|uniref:serine hydrolase domain-containing protein n=1 Tax=Vibrio jasicida TaxID=766224 RepID=UPI000CE475EF|nr:serine hydrolase [Vibrio jasicida]